jgi:cytochrome c biogenesis protein CcmG, thiol:disulfide interchange protein DsbE
LRELANASKPHIVIPVRRAVLILASVALVAVVVIGLTQAGQDEPSASEAPPFDLAEAKQRLAGAPAPLAALHDQSNQLLTGGTEAFEERIAELEGHPTVVNKWASWCGPCRSEFPVFQQVATERGKQIAFVGVNSKDKRPAAEKFLAERPLPFPSYEDPDDEIAAGIDAAKVAPVTVFIDDRGEIAFVHTGEYRSAQELEADIDRYLGA